MYVTTWLAFGQNTLWQSNYMNIQSIFSHIIQVKCQLLEVKNKRQRNFSNAYKQINLFAKKKNQWNGYFFSKMVKDMFAQSKHNCAVMSTA